MSLDTPLQLFHANWLREGNDPAKGTEPFLVFSDVADVLCLGDRLVVEAEAQPVVDTADERVQGGMRRVY